MISVTRSSRPMRVPPRRFRGAASASQLLGQRDESCRRRRVAAAAARFARARPRLDARRPDRTAPGPDRSRARASRRAPRIRWTISVKRTGAVTCARSSSAIRAAVGVGLGLDVGHDRRPRHRRSARARARARSLPGRRRHQRAVEGRRHRRAAACASRRARAPAAQATSTAAASPAITVCARRVVVRRRHHAPRLARPRSRQASATSLSLAPITAAIAPRPSGTASCMKRPRACTSRTASSNRARPSRSRPARVYSPRLWPATKAGASGRRAPRARAAARCWWRGSRAAGSRCAAARPRDPRSRASRAERRAHRRRPRRPRAPRATPRTTSRPMPTSWEPCPGKSSASTGDVTPRRSGSTSRPR